MLAMEQGTREKWPVDGEVLRGGAVGSSYRFGTSKFEVARRSNGAFEPLHTALPEGGEALPVFAAEQAARRYLRSETSDTGWYVRATRNGELTSMLISLCRGVESVLVDPDSASHASAGSGDLVSRESFLNACLRPGLAPGGCQR